MRKLLLAAILLVATRFAAPAMVFWNLDNDANLTDPGTGAPWSAVAKIYDPTNNAVSGSAVYLGNGFLLTANHVFVGPNPTYHTNNYSSVNFGSTNSFLIDPTFGTYGIQVAPGVDMKVIKLTLDPSGVNAATLLSTPTEEVAPATIIGWGVGRDPSSPLGSTNVTWGNTNTSAKRWGVNEPKTVGTNPYDYIATVAGATGPEFDPDGLGDAEASVTLLDSGSGLFQEIGGDWYLIGITTSTDTKDAAIYGNDATSGSHGDFDYFARISSYDQQIIALIPEPSTVSLLASACGTLAWALLRRHQRG